MRERKCKMQNAKFFRAIIILHSTFYIKKGAVKKRKFFTAPFQGREKKMQNEQTELKIKLLLYF